MECDIYGVMHTHRNIMPLRREHITTAYFREEFAKLNLPDFERRTWVSRSPSVRESGITKRGVSSDDRFWMHLTYGAHDVASEFCSTP